jgi:membrane carboxypeptidase/penicillin-binding protein PbpC
MLAAVEHVRGRLPIDDPAPIAAPTDDLRRVELCTMSGLPAGQVCPTRRTEWVPAAVDHQTCDWHHASETGLVTIWPHAFRAWARERGLLDGRALGGTALFADARLANNDRAAERIAPITATPGGPRHPARVALAIVRPLGGALFLIDPTLRPEFQTLTLSASGGAPGPIEWRVDGTLVGVDEGTRPVRWPLARGRHEITVHDSAGQSARTHVDVR